MLRLFNTLTRKIEPFTPTEDKRIKMYTCGPSTYQPAHIGNYRTFLFEDVLQRYLEYSGYRVMRLITLTDVEDKALTQARNEKLSTAELTQRNENRFFQDFELLKIKTPNYTVKASSVVDQAATLITTLIEKGYAYWHTHKGAKNAYFDPLKFRGFGKLTGLDMRKWPKKRRRFHLDTYPGTPWNRGDFILWHGCKEDDGECWETQIGRGRPAWNIQDAAIVTKHLGFTVDVAAGGIDNIVRHHDYVIAVAESISGREFAKYWLHGAHLYVDGKKMSKSKGNVHYPTDLIEKGFRKDHVRFFLIYGHYRKKLNFTYKKLAETSRRLDAFKRMVKDLENAEAAHSSEKAKKLTDSIVLSFELNMDNDLDVKAAFNKLYESLSKLHKLLVQRKLSAKDAKAAIDGLHRIDSVLQVIF